MKHALIQMLTVVLYILTLEKIQINKVYLVIAMCILFIWSTLFNKYNIIVIKKKSLQKYK